MTFSEAMAARVLELEAALRAAQKRTRDLEASRDRWRRAAKTTLHCVSCNARRAA